MKTSLGDKVDLNLETESIHKVRRRTVSKPTVGLPRESVRKLVGAPGILICAELTVNGPRVYFGDTHIEVIERDSMKRKRKRIEGEEVKKLRGVHGVNCLLGVEMSARLPHALSPPYGHPSS